jgi:hypothetical protein
MRPEDEMTTPDQEAPVGSPADTTAAPPADSLRCSDAERERTSTALHEAAGDGRLTMDETEARLAQVYAARHRHELDALTADLPAPDVRTGWGLVIALARQQLIDDVAALAGRGDRDAVSRRRRVLLALAALLVVLVVVAMTVLALHGIVGEGPEEHVHGLD